MADRWSAPSAAEGTNRFRVWPAPTDSYDDAEMAANWDMLDSILGLPASGTWPTTVGTDGGIYKEIEKVRFSATPLGTVFPWFRPSVVVPIPTEYEICDGSTIAAINHDFPTTDPVVLPNLLNAFVLGADPAGEAGVAKPNVNNSELDAPGPQATGGSNTNVLLKHQLPAHTHSGSYSGWSPPVMMWYSQTSQWSISKDAPQYLDTRDEAIERCGWPGCYGDPERFQPVYPAQDNFKYEWWGVGTNHSTGQGGWKSGQHRHNLTGLSSEGTGTVHENRPLYIGLIYLVKVRVT